MIHTNMMQSIQPIRLRATGMLAVSFGFTCLLLLARVMYTGSIQYIFYVWNFLLALVPLCFSRLFSPHKPLLLNMALLAGWLLFLPNAPYLVTDIVHFGYHPPVPIWFDLVVVTSAAWNGLLVTICSLLQAERFLRLYYPRYIDAIMSGILFLCGYGVYIGRFWRFNSWDVFTQPLSLAGRLFSPVMNPAQHLHIWAFSLVFAGMLLTVYYTVKNTGTLRCYS